MASIVASGGWWDFYDGGELYIHCVGDMPYPMWENDDATLLQEQTTSVRFSDTVTNIGNGAFTWFENLESVTISDSVTIIDEYAFAGVGTLRRIVIPTSVTMISDGAFEECWSLSDIYYTGTEAQWNAITIGENNDGIESVATVHYNDVPPGSGIQEIPVSGLRNPLAAVVQTVNRIIHTVNAGANTSSATTFSSGLMSASDKSKLDGIESGAEVNALESVKVNGTALSIAQKAVNILIAVGASNGSISVNGVDVAVTGLAALAYKSEVSTSDLAAALKAVIDAKAEASTVSTLIGGDTGKSVRTIANEELAAQLIPANAQEALDTLQEISAWIQSHPNEVAAIRRKLTLGANGETEYATVKDYVEAVTSGLIKLTALSVSTSGDGNAVTEMSYNNSTGAFTLTKGTTFLTEHQDISGKVDKVDGKGLSTNDYTTAEKNKLAGIAANATANTGTITGIKMNGASKGTSGVVDLGTVLTAHQSLAGKQDKLSVTGAENRGVYVSAAGVLSQMAHTLDTDVPADAVFTDTTYTLSSLGIGNVKNYDQSKAIKSITRSGATFTYTCLDGTTGTFTQQDNNTWTAMAGASSSANGSAGYVPAPPRDGYNTKYLRADGTWSIPPNTNTTYTAATSVPLMDGTAAVGTSAAYARGDHRHPTDTSRASADDVTAQGNRITDLERENALLRNYLLTTDAYRTASGNPVTFDDGYAANVKDLIVTITPTQAGEGDPSPDNIRPISGVSSVSVTRTGENGANAQSVTVSMGDAGTVYGGTLNVTTGLLVVTHRLTELDNTFQANQSKASGIQSGRAGFYIYGDSYFPGAAPSGGDANPNGVVAYYSHCVSGLNANQAILLKNFGIGIGSANKQFMLWFNIDAATANTVSEFQTWLGTQKSNGTSLQVLYPLKTPVAYQLAPAQLATLAGYNVVFADGGTPEVTYRRDPALALGG